MTNKQKTRIITDDCSNLHDTKSKSTALTQSALHRRHIRLRCRVITQKYHTTAIRENTTMLVLLYDKNETSKDAAFEENNTGMLGWRKTV